MTFYRVLALREECCVLWRITPYTFISPTKMTILFGTVRFTKTCKMSKVHARSHEITNKPLRVRTTKTLWYRLEKLNAARCASDVKKKMKNRRKQNSASKIPSKFPRNRPFFPLICPRKSREIDFFPRPTRGPVTIGVIYVIILPRKVRITFTGVKI